MKFFEQKIKNHLLEMSKWFFIELSWFF